MQEEQVLFLQKIEQADIRKIIFSNGKGEKIEYRKVCICAKQRGYQIEKYTDKQVFHENISELHLLELCETYLKMGYRQLDIFTEKIQYSMKISKKGKCLFGENSLAGKEIMGTNFDQTKLSHNRKKNYLIEEGQVIAPLIDMGIFTKEGKVVKSMYDKFKQINRFLEIIDDAIKDSGLKQCNIIDFGCGKSYLTFIVYYYFTYIRKIPVSIVGLDLKADVITKCNEAAKRYGYENLRFELGDINGYEAKFPVDMVLTLHACDTATDYALYNAVCWKAKMIFSVPCCQHELNQQMKSEDYSILTRYGIIKERFAALSTDAIRGNLLEYCGYKTQLLEFVDLSHTPKNILIRAIRKPVVTKSVKEKRLLEVEKMMEEFHLSPTLYRLLEEGGMIHKEFGNDGAGYVKSYF